MSNEHADKARTLIAIAEKNRQVLLADVSAASKASGSPSTQQRFEFALRQDDLRMLASVAQVHATLATVRENEVFDAPPPAEEPLPEHESAFDAFMGNPLDLLDAVVTVGRAFTGQRPIKDSPQA